MIRLLRLKLRELVQHLRHRILLHLHIMHEARDEQLIPRELRHALPDALTLPHRDQARCAE